MPSATSPCSATEARRRSNRPGITLHRTSTLLTSQITLRRNIPVTKPARTIDDLSYLPRALVDTAIRRAHFHGYPVGQPNCGLIRSKNEASFLALLRRHRLPLPEVNASIDPYEVDFLWREHCLIVELDAFSTHGSEPSFQADRERDVRLKLRGFDVVRFTDRDITERADYVIATLRALLSAA